jgi:queuosine precursor transporter
MHTNKKQTLFIALAAIFLTNAILAEMIGVKIFSAETTLGLPPANIPLFGGLMLDFNLTAGVVIWPVVFITTDIINEYYGKKGVKRLSYIAAACIAYAFVVIYVITLLPPAPFWTDINATDPQGNSFNINFAFTKIFSQGLGIIVGSLVAFLVGQFMDVFVFQKLKQITGNKMIWLRATGSTLVSQLIDSFVVLGLAFYVLAPADSRWSVEQVTSVGIINYIYKFTIAIVLTPLIYFAHNIIDRYLGKELSEEMMKDASEGN